MAQRMSFMAPADLPMPFPDASASCTAAHWSSGFPSLARSFARMRRQSLSSQARGRLRSSAEPFTPHGNAIHMNRSGSLRHFRAITRSSASVSA
jgi:hypothetical protein